jgi:hypothetical protein
MKVSPPFAREWTPYGNVARISKWKTTNDGPPKGDGASALNINELISRETEEEFGKDYITAVSIAPLQFIVFPQSTEYKQGQLR